MSTEYSEEKKLDKYNSSLSNMYIQRIFHRFTQHFDSFNKLKVEVDSASIYLQTWY